MRRLFTGIASAHLETVVNGGGCIVVSRTRHVTSMKMGLGLVASRVGRIRLVTAKDSSFRLTSGLGRPLAKEGQRCGVCPLSFNRLIRRAGLLRRGQVVPRELICNCCPRIIAGRKSRGLVLGRLTSDCLCGSVLALSSVKGPSGLIGLLRTLTLRVNSRISCDRMKRLIKLSAGAISECVSILRGGCMVFHLGSFTEGLHGRLGIDQGVCFCSGKVHGTMLTGFSVLRDHARRRTKTL